MGSGVLAGVSRFFHVHAPWRLMLHPVDTPLPEVLAEEPDVDGILALAWGHEGTFEDLQEASKRYPVVLVTGRDSPPGPPRVLDDDQGAVESAFTHLRELGHENMAIVGASESTVDRRRRRLFTEHVEQAGLELYDLQYDLNHEGGYRLGPRKRFQQVLREWILSAPRPLAVFALDGVYARDLMDACRSVGRLVPEDVAVVAIGYDKLLAETCTPRLSIVDMNWEGVGYAAAEMLQTLMDGGELSEPVVTAASRGVVASESSDTLAIEDAVIASAVREIRRRACEDVSIEQILETIPASRRKIEMGIRKSLGVTIQQEIIRHRMRRAQALLRHSRLPVIDISVRCGFRSRSRFYELFRESTGMSPNDYRLRRR
jgi:LacI family transcriptional regulator